MNDDAAASLSSRDTGSVHHYPRSGALPRDMVWVPGGEFLMGSDRHYQEEAPAHRVLVTGFWMDRTTVTNSEFRRFVEDSGYVTLAERSASAAKYPDATPNSLAPSSAVFIKPPRGIDRSNHYNWWAYVRGANWRHPRGPASSLKGLENHPAVHIAYEDAQAYAEWAYKELPTEAEWEFAARGGLEGAEFVWGEELTPEGYHMANIWQGEFPWQNLCQDGYEGRRLPLRFRQTDTGSTTWRAMFGSGHQIGIRTIPGSTVHAARLIIREAGGWRTAATSGIPRSVQPRKVIKGGSHLCAPNYCRRYRPAARMAHPIDTSTCHVGFRCIARHDRSDGVTL